VYSTIVLMVAVTTIITPIWLKMEYRKEMQRQGDGLPAAGQDPGGGDPPGGEAPRKESR